MGSRVDEREEITVLVTGFGPFLDTAPVNPAWEIAKDLPAYLPPLNPKDPSARQAFSSRPVRILVHPEAIRVNYQVVRALVPVFWEMYQGHRIDYTIHIGMAGAHPHYQIERKGHRSGYVQPDVDGLIPDLDRYSRGKDWVWYGLPEWLETDLDMPDLLSRWKANSPIGLDLRISDNAGRYLCEFIYYSSLSYLYKHQKERNVVFLHVPSDASDIAVNRGRELVLTLIRSLVESNEARSTREGPREHKTVENGPAEVPS
ncbi:putative pyroglutamyl peptidase type I [Stachybotrys elegans]|uniref:Pyroglutamyl peptidase type I n=1 Tax=Stachybotrys elegans TaxID=80388 RepID=A0A8K0T645_9HYPO|nr:putative pyroglutamyl peptidase type I [Stachybotrys elegans]